MAHLQGQCSIACGSGLLRDGYDMMHIFEGTLMIQKLLVVMAMVGVAQGGQILSNPGFESGSLSPWTGSWSITSSNCHSGSFCVTSPGNNELTQTFAAVAVGSITDISFWDLHPDANVTQTAVDLLYQGGGDDEFIVTTSGTGWNLLDVLGDLRASGSLVGIGLWGNTQGVTMLDDVSITTSGGVPEPSTVALAMAGLGALAVFRLKRSKRVRT